MQVLAEGPGLVQAIHVSVGGAVVPDQELLTLEAMKMLQPVLAPTSGRVVALHVAVGDFVNPGALLVTIE